MKQVMLNNFFKKRKRRKEKKKKHGSWAPTAHTCNASNWEDWS
jgi:hypothetical protein